MKKDSARKDGTEKERPEEPRPQKLTFRQRLKTAFNGISRKNAGSILKSTLKDLRQPKEIGILLVSSFIPGGWIGYCAYRVAKYKLQQEPANDDKPSSEKPEKAQKPKSGKPPKPPIP